MKSITFETRCAIDKIVDQFKHIGFNDNNYFGSLLSLDKWKQSERKNALSPSFLGSVVTGKGGVVKYIQERLNGERNNFKSPGTFWKRSALYLKAQTINTSVLLSTLL